MTPRATVSVFGSSSPSEGSKEYDVAYRLGSALAQAGFHLCNGGYGGTMEAGARGALDAGGSTTGVTLSGSSRRANRWIEDVCEADSLWERMRTLMSRADAFAVLPGGTGTLAELAMMLELVNKNVINFAPAVLLGDYWGPLLDLMADEGILREEHGLNGLDGVDVRGAVGLADDPDRAARWLQVNVQPGT